MFVSQLSNHISRVLFLNKFLKTFWLKNIPLFLTITNTKSHLLRLFRSGAFYPIISFKKKLIHFIVGTNSASFAMAASTGVLSVGSTALAATVNTTYVLTLSATGTSSAASDTVTLALTSATTCASDSDSDSGAAQLSRVLVVLLLSVLTAVSM